MDELSYGDSILISMCEINKDEFELQKVLIANGANIAEDGGLDSNAQ